MGTNLPTDDTTAFVGDYDGGSCCDTNAEFLKQTGQVNLTSTPTTNWKYATNTASEVGAAANGVAGWAATCVAITNTLTDATGTATLGQGSFD